MEEISLDTIDLKPTSDFGGGLEFLMNDKKKENVDTFSIEEELKELDNFPEERVKEIKPIRLNFDNTNDTIKIGKDTASIDTFEQSSTGFRHMNDIPVEEIKNIFYIRRFCFGSAISSVFFRSRFNFSLDAG